MDFFLNIKFKVLNFFKGEKTHLTSFLIMKKHGQVKNQM